jgi:hypothetical protein
MAGGSLNVKHLWIQGGTNGAADVSETTPEYPGQVGKIGTIKPSAGKVPRVLQFVQRVSTDTTVAAANYAVAYWQDIDDFVVCADQTLAMGGSTSPIPAGVFLGTNPAAGKYGFIQVAGHYPLDLNLSTTADLAVGGPLYLAGADSDGLVSMVVAGTDAATNDTEWAIARFPRVGIALAAQTDSSGTVNALLEFPRNGW